MAWKFFVLGIQSHVSVCYALWKKKRIERCQWKRNSPTYTVETNRKRNIERIRRDILQSVGTSNAYEHIERNITHKFNDLFCVFVIERRRRRRWTNLKDSTKKKPNQTYTYNASISILECVFGFLHFLEIPFMRVVLFEKSLKDRKYTIMTMAGIASEWAEEKKYHTIEEKRREI